jgi:hypothetical protein
MRFLGRFEGFLVVCFVLGIMGWLVALVGMGLECYRLSPGFCVAWL